VKLALGTAQFGLKYGISNQKGQITLSDAKDILDTARELGINMLDTASAYGKSESFLGELNSSDFQIVTKAPPHIKQGVSMEKWLKSQLNISLKNLRSTSLYGFLLHRANMIHSGTVKEINKMVNEARDSGLIKKFGVSVYNPEELDAIIHIKEIQLVQAPFNLLDRRLEKSGWLQRLYDNGIEVHLRSVFLQGLLLLKNSLLPPQFMQWRGIFRSWEDWLEKSESDAIQTCLAGVNDRRVSRVVIGVESARQLRQVADAALFASQSAFPDLTCNDLNLINPVNWRSI